MSYTSIKIGRRVLKVNKEDILRKDEITNLPAGMRVDGLVLIRTYSEQPTKNGSMYLAGQMECVGTVQFKVWAGNTFNQISENPITETICRIVGEVNDFAGVKSIIIKECYPYEGNEFTPLDFLERKYDSEALYNKMRSIIEAQCSNNALQIFDMVMEPIKNRFMYEFAAIYHHDACVSGLLAHTTKLVRLAQILKFYPDLSKAVDIDTLYVGAAFHDVGKILEYSNGSLSQLGSMMSHLTLGIEIVRPYKNRIIELKGERFYNDIISVIQQHHNEYGERPRTLVAYIVSILDGLEAQLTDIQEQVIQAKNDVIKIDGNKLSFVMSGKE